jgi:hypothetical protein
MNSLRAEIVRLLAERYGLSDDAILECLAFAKGTFSIGGSILSLFRQSSRPEEVLRVESSQSAGPSEAGKYAVAARIA